MSDASLEKDKLRKRLVEQRLALSPSEVAKASLAVAERIRSLTEWKNAWSVLLYWPIKNEIDTRPLLTELWERGAIALLPRCRPDQPGFMKNVRNAIHKLTLPLTVFGVVLSTLHQSSLGALYIAVPSKLHPLWYSPYLAILFFVSSIPAGLSMRRSAVTSRREAT